MPYFTITEVVAFGVFGTKGHGRDAFDGERPAIGSPGGFRPGTGFGFLHGKRKIGIDAVERFTDFFNVFAPGIRNTQAVGYRRPAITVKHIRYFWQLFLVPFHPACGAQQPELLACPKANHDGAFWLATCFHDQPCSLHGWCGT